MFSIKKITQLILLSTIFSVVIVLSIKYLEIQRDYPREYFCVTCPCLPDPSIPRNFEVGINFNLLILLDFIAMLLIILLFGLENYYEHNSYLFAFHVCRFIFNTTNFLTSDITGKVLRPMFNEFCGFGGVCSNEKILPHTTVGLLYLIYFSVMTTNFAFTIFLLSFYESNCQERRTPVVMRLNSIVRSNRPPFTLNLPSPFNAAPCSPYNRSPSPPKLARVVPRAKLAKYHRLDSTDSYIFRNSKNRVMPLTLNEFQPQFITAE